MQHSVFSTVMLTKKDIMDLYYDGLEVKIRRKKQAKGLKGDYDPSSVEINIYPSNIISEEERDITLLHEFIHARYDKLGEKNISDARIENEAKKTYEKRPSIMALIKELYKI